MSRERSCSRRSRFAECAARGPQRTLWAGLFNGFQAAVGLLLLSVVTPAALAEDRRTAASSCSFPRRSRLAAWCSEVVRRSTALCRLWLSARGRRGGARDCARSLARSHAGAGLVLAQGAAVTSLGIALATWIPRVDRALILSAAAAVVVTVAWVPLALATFRRYEPEPRPGLGQPVPGCRALDDRDGSARPPRRVARARAGWAAFWIVTFSAVAAGSALGDAQVV